MISGVYSGMEKMNLTHKLVREIREGQKPNRVRNTFTATKWVMISGKF